MNKEMIARIKKLAVPIGLGVFALVMVLLGVIYFLQQQQQDTLRAEITNMEKTVNKPYTVSEQLQNNFKQILQYIPVVSETPGEEQWTEEAFQQNVINTIINHANDQETYPSIIIEPLPDASSNFSIETIKFRDKVKVGSSHYRVYTFDINTSNVGYEEIMLFAENISGLDGLRTLVVENINYSIGADVVTTRFNIGVYVNVR